jgi:hypothetical protein
LHGRLLYARCLDRDQEKLDEKVFSAGRVGSGDLAFTEPITANAVVFPLALCLLSIRSLANRSHRVNGKLNGPGFLKNVCKTKNCETAYAIFAAARDEIG